MRRARFERTAAALGVAVTSALLASFGCTFLVTFDDKPHDAGSALVAPDPSSTSPTSTNTVPTSTPTTPPPQFDAGNGCDRSLATQDVGGCDGFAVPNAQVCATNPGLDPYPFSATEARDLVTCNAGAATCVVHCATRCAALPNGFPDQCDLCNGRTGAYCGVELGWSGKSAELLAHCNSGTLSASQPPQPCTGGCRNGAGQGTASCQ